MHFYKMFALDSPHLKTSDALEIMSKAFMKAKLNNLQQQCDVTNMVVDLPLSRLENGTLTMVWLRLSKHY